MNQTDDRILDLLDESGLDLSPVVLAHNLDYSRSWVSQRLSKLKQAGLVELVDEKYYRISETGEAYLSGEINAEEINIED